MNNIKTKIIITLIVSILICSTIVIGHNYNKNEDYKRQEETSGHLVPSSSDVTIGDTFYVDFYVYSNNSVTSFTIRQLFFNETTAGLVNVTQNPGGTPNEDYNCSFYPNWSTALTDDGDLDNSTGNYTYIQSVNMSGVEGNNTAIRINFSTNYCGLLRVYIPTTIWSGQSGLDIGVGAADLWTDGYVTIHPEAPENFTASTYNMSIVNLSFNFTNGATNIVVCGKAGSYPTDYNDNQIYNGTMTTYDHHSLNPGTTYYYRAWSWNDSGGDFSLTNLTATNTTTSNTPPTISNPSPANGTTNVDIMQGTVNATVEDAQGNDISGTIRGTEINPYTGGGANRSVLANTLTPLPYNTIINWWVNMTDGYNESKEMYTFTTRNYFIPSPPSAFSASPYNKTVMNISWTPAGSNLTYVEYNTVESWTRGEGILLENGSNTTTSQDGLTPATTYYYLAWSYNETDEKFSTTNTSANGTTSENHAPAFYFPNPINGSSGVNVSLAIVNVTILDEDGDTFTWSIEGINITANNSAWDTNGSKEANINGPLEYNTTYTWWVNATDGYNVTNVTYTFGTELNPGYMTVWSPIPINVSIGNTRPTANISISAATGSPIDIYFYYYNITPVTNTTSLFKNWSGQTSGRFEFNTSNALTPANPNGDTRFIWGDTQYIWWINVTDGTNWVNKTYYFNTSGSRYDVANSGDVVATDVTIDWSKRQGEVGYDNLYDVDYSGDVTATDCSIIWENRT